MRRLPRFRAATPCADRILRRTQMRNSAIVVPFSHVRRIRTLETVAESIGRTGAAPSRGGQRMSRPRTSLAIVLAAGEGTRMRSRRPKVLHALAGRSLLGHVIAAIGR